VTIIATDSAIVPTNTGSVVKTEPFTDAHFTAQGEPRAKVSLSQLDTLWLNTGTLCNIACDNCYIESTPTNDRLAYLTLAEALVFLDEIQS
jgi:sulfatase maturation enzyme AslB (radical SAM superfamily)